MLRQRELIPGLGTSETRLPRIKLASPRLCQLYTSETKQPPCSLQERTNTGKCFQFREGRWARKDRKFLAFESPRAYMLSCNPQALLSFAVTFLHFFIFLALGALAMQLTHFLSLAFKASCQGLGLFKGLLYVMYDHQFRRGANECTRERKSLELQLCTRRSSKDFHSKIKTGSLTAKAWPSMFICKYRTSTYAILLRPPAANVQPIPTKTRDYLMKVIFLFPLFQMSLGNKRSYKTARFFLEARPRAINSESNRTRLVLVLKSAPETRLSQ